MPAPPEPPTADAPAPRPVPAAVEVAAQLYRRGSPPSVPAHLVDEVPQEVLLTHSLVVATTEVTQAQWGLVFASRPSPQRAPCPACPVESVTWWDTLAFANACSERENLQPCCRLSGCRGEPGDGQYSFSAGCRSNRVTASWSATVGSGAGKRCWSLTRCPVEVA